MENNFPKRTRLRLYGCDYSANGTYFVTLCTKNRAKILSEITVGDGAHDVPKVRLTEIGKTVEKYLISSENIPGVLIDTYVIMPNHIHVLICIKNGYDGTSWALSPTNKTLPRIISSFKSLITKELGASVFQRSYYDHVIRNREDYEEIKDYILKNPINWTIDELYS